MNACPHHYTTDRRCQHVDGAGHRGAHVAPLRGPRITSDARLELRLGRRRGRDVRWLDATQRGIRRRALQLGLGAAAAIALSRATLLEAHDLVGPHLWPLLPFLFGAVSYGSSEEAVTVTGWNSLTNNTRGASAGVSNASNLYHAVDLEVTLDTGGTGPTGGAYCEVWLEPSTDAGTTFAEDQGIPCYNHVMSSSANTTTRVTWSTDRILAILPQNYRFAIVNRTGQTKGADDTLNLRGKKAA